MANAKAMEARDFKAGDRVQWQGGFVSLIREAATVNFGTVWIHEWEPSIGGASRIVLQPTMPLERLST